MSAPPNHIVVDDGVRPTEAPPEGPELVSDGATRAVVLAMVFLAGFNLRLVATTPLTALIVVATIPMWWRAVFRFEFSRILLGLGCAAIPAGFLLASLSTDHSISRLAQIGTLMLLVGGLAVLVVVLWGRAHFPLHVVAVAYGAGDVVNVMLFTDRSWKYQLALPATVVVVGWLGKYRPHLPAIMALVALGVITALDRGRSFFAFCLLAACLLTWQAMPKSAGARARLWTPALVLAGAGLLIYDIAVRLLAHGYLGQAAQRRTISQVETSGSLLLGGRPSAVAAVDLIQERPWGYGIGVVPNTHDYAIVTSSFESINLFEHGYIMRYILDGQFNLHSIGADLWIGYGLIGLALVATMLLALIRTLSILIGQRRCPPLVALMTILATWYIFFEPAYSYGNDVFFALGITLLPRAVGRVTSQVGRTHRNGGWSAASDAG